MFGDEVVQLIDDMRAIAKHLYLAASRARQPIKLRHAVHAFGLPQLSTSSFNLTRTSSPHLNPRVSPSWRVRAPHASSPCRVPECLSPGGLREQFSTLLLPSSGAGSLCWERDHSRLHAHCGLPSCPPREQIWRSIPKLPPTMHLKLPTMPLKLLPRMLQKLLPRRLPSRLPLQSLLLALGFQSISAFVSVSCGLLCIHHELNCSELCFDNFSPLILQVLVLSQIFPFSLSVLCVISESYNSPVL